MQSIFRAMLLLLLFHREDVYYQSKLHTIQMVLVSSGQWGVHGMGPGAEPAPYAAEDLMYFY